MGQKNHEMFDVDDVIIVIIVIWGPLPWPQFLRWRLQILYNAILAFMVISRI